MERHFRDGGEGVFQKTKSVFNERGRVGEQGMRYPDEHPNSREGGKTAPRRQKCNIRNAQIKFRRQSYESDNLRGFFYNWPVGGISPTLTSAMVFNGRRLISKENHFITRQRQNMSTTPAWQAVLSLSPKKPRQGRGKPTHSS